MRHLVTRSVALACGWALLCLSACQGETGDGTVFVVDNLDDDGVGSLRRALREANRLPGADRVAFEVTGTIDLTSGQLEITDDVHIVGPGAEALTVSAGGSSRILLIHSEGEEAGPMVTISGLTFSDGMAEPLTALWPNPLDRLGGGILNGNGSLWLHHVAITGNHGRSADPDGETGVVFGAGLCNAGGSVVLTDAVVAGNIAEGGAGGVGGGIFNAWGTLQVTDSRFEDNVTHGCVSEGGAIYNRAYLQAEFEPDCEVCPILPATLSDTASSLVGNQALFEKSNPAVTCELPLGLPMPWAVGGAIGNTASNMEISDSVFLHNLAYAKPHAHIASGAMGGAIQSIGIAQISPDALSSVHVEGSTFTGNRAVIEGEAPNLGMGGGIYNGTSPTTASDPSTLVIEDCRFERNRAVASDWAIGGGIWNFGQADISDSTFENNRAEGGNLAVGGGVGNGNAASLEMRGGSVVGNRATALATDPSLPDPYPLAGGGGVFNSPESETDPAGVACVDGTTVEGNTATADPEVGTVGEGDIGGVVSDSCP